MSYRELWWFSPEKALPKADRRVLIYPGRYGDVSVGHYSSRVDAPGVWHDDTEQVGDEGCQTMIEVKWWAILPEPPRDKPSPQEQR